MKCPECVKAGEKSTVFEGVGTVTCMYFQPYYDEEGEYHHHDGNSYTNSYSCSNGHQWSTSTTGRCPHPKCDYGKANP